MIIRVIAGTKYNKKNVELAIKNLKPVPDKDIVVFYYTGHGFRKPTERKKISQFPFLDLRSKTDSNYMAQSRLNIEKDIFNKIVSKGARFNLVLGIVVILMFRCQKWSLLLLPPKGDPVLLIE